MGRFEWVRHLPSEAIDEFVTEIEETVKAEQSLAPVFASWKATAEVYSNPELHKRLISPSEGDFGTVEPPEAES